jgi:glycosyltransferase involved in cell wall biosynthesis
VSASDGYDVALVNTLLDAFHAEGLGRLLPVVLWIHEGRFGLINNPAPIRSLRRWFGSAQRIVFQSEYQSGSVFRSFVFDLPEERVVIVPNGLPQQPKPALPACSSLARRIICVGSINGRKRQGDLARAVLALVDRHDIECEFVGDAEHIDNLGAADVALMTGHPGLRLSGGLSSSETLTRVSAAEVLVLPSSDESQPLAPLEAAQLGVPVVLADLEVYRHLGWRNGENCLCYPLGDVAALAACLERVLADPALAARLAEGGRRFAARFSVDDFFDRMTAVVEGLFAQDRQTVGSEEGEQHG